MFKTIGLDSRWPVRERVQVLKIAQCVCLIVFVLVGSVSFADESSKSPASQSSQFPVDSFLRPRVDFWKKVYTEITSGEAFLHDKDDPSLIYKKINIKGMSRRSRRRMYRREKKHIRNLLTAIASKNRQNLNDDEREINEILGDRSPQEIRELSRQIRMQIGMMDRYFKGLERSYQYMEEMKAIFRNQGLPEELVYLPHVESSFNEKAYSKVGAAGMWQFMRQTARLYNLKLSYVIDERRDALASTKAAARFLKDNYDRLQTWPLALTAYNHGPLSLERAINNLGTRDISAIIQRYKGRRFGFASKNFYATFMATVEISKDPKKYFPGFVPPKKIPYTRIQLPKPLTVNQIAKTLDVPKSEIRKLNRSIRPIAFRGRFYIPKGFSLKIPFVTENQIAEYRQKLEGVQASARAVAAGAEHIVSRGESLYLIARVYGVSMTDLIILNEISNPSRVMPGMKIKIPGKATKTELAAKKQEIKKLVEAKEKTEEESASVVAKAEAAKISQKEKIAVADRNELNIEKLEPEPEKVAINTPQEKELGFWSRIKSFFVAENTQTGGRVESVKDLSLSSDESDKPVAETEEETATPIPFDDEFYDFSTEWTKDGRLKVTVEVEETIGHLADWGGIRASDIRRANYMQFGDPVHVGQTLKLPISQKALMEFNLKRIQFHQALEEDLYSNYRITGIKEYKIKRGDTIGEITMSNEIPMWLLRKYQPASVIQSSLQIGQILKLPQLEPIGESVPLSSEVEEN